MTALLYCAKFWDTIMQCKTCGADVEANGVWTAFARERGCPSHLMLSHAAASARFCQYARERGKPCANPCQAIDKAHTFEARVAGLSATMNHPEIIEVTGPWAGEFTT